MIYKPTDLSPSAQAFDVTNPPVFVECKVDTSNVTIGGYTIKLLNSENNVVFSSYNDETESLNINKISKINELGFYVVSTFPQEIAEYGNLVNSGVNGSYLKIPFLINKTDLPPQGNSVRLNQIYYNSSDDTVRSGVNDEVLNIFNGQEYKWIITLYQLENGLLPENPLYYDMTIASGTILGSNNVRIQTVHSDEIYGDYFIQPVFINNLDYDPKNPEVWTGDDMDETVSGRVLIKSYDPTNGFIYPETGTSGFGPEVITESKANAFRVYKQGNIQEDLTATQQVVYVLDGDSGTLDATAPIEWVGRGIYLPKDVVMYKNIAYECIEETSSTDETAPRNDTTHWKRYYGAYWIWHNSLAAPGESYGVYTYYSDQNPNGVYNINGLTFLGSERTVLNHQLSKKFVDNNGNYLGSPYNGIYYPTFSIKETNAYSNTTTYHYGDMVVSSTDQVYMCNGIVRGISPNQSSVANKYWNEIGTPSDSSNVSSWDENFSYEEGVIVKVTDSSSIIKYYKCTGAVYGENPTNPGTIYWGASPETFAYQIEARWTRVPDADSWGELINKIVLVTAGVSYNNQNIQVKPITENTNVYGTINETPFLFVPERPAEIYKNNYQLYEYNNSYSSNDVVRYIKSGSYIEWSSNDNYTPGTVVYIDHSDDAPDYYLCIQSTDGSNNPENATDYWGKYEAYSYYISKIDNNSDLPISATGSISNNWTENQNLSNTGIIFYNKALGGGNSSGRLYIRSLSDLQSGLSLFKNSITNKFNYVKIEDCSTKYNFITYNQIYEYDISKPYDLSATPPNPSSRNNEDIEWIPADNEGNGTKYQIRTFFNKSDERTFSFYSDSSLDITITQNQNASITVEANYSQLQNIHWKYLQWFLRDEYHQIIQMSDIIYDGEIRYTFYGIPEGKYEVELVVENYAGAQKQGYKDSSYDTSFDNGSSSDISLIFDCDTSSLKSLMNIPVQNIDIYKREVWYDYTGSYDVDSQTGERYPKVTTKTEDSWHRVLYTGLDDFSANEELYDFNISNNRYYEYSYLYKTSSDDTYKRLRKASPAKWMGWTLTELHEVSDDEGNIAYEASKKDVWKFKYNISPGDTAENLSRNMQETLGRFPKFIQGPKNNASGSVSCLLGRELLPANITDAWFDYVPSFNDEGSWEYDAFKTYRRNLGGYKETLWDDNDIIYSRTSNKQMDCLKYWLAFCYSGNPKLLKDSQGRRFLVQIQDPNYHMEETWNGRPITVNFNWTEIKDAANIPIIGKASVLTDDDDLFDYVIRSDGRGYIITGLKNPDNPIDTLIIPDTHNWLPVVEIADNAFSGVSFSNLVIGKNIVKIGANAFTGPITRSVSPNPTNVTINAISCLDVSNRAFTNRTIKIIKVGVNVRNISKNILGGNGLDNTINNNAFKGCSLIQNITIPWDVSEIGDAAFSGCTNLSDITFEGVPSSIGTDVFPNECPIANVKLSADLISYIPQGKLENVEITGGTSIDNDAFQNCATLKNFTIKANTITTIGAGAFSGCSGLASIVLPTSITIIGEGAFSGCSSLQTMTLPFVGGSKTAATASASTLFGYIFGRSSYEGGVATLQQYDDTHEITYYIPSLLTTVTVLLAVTITVDETLPYGAFSGCSNLTKIYMSETFSAGAQVGDYAFFGCSNLVDVELPAITFSIGNSAFEGCSKLREIKLPYMISSIGDSAFKSSGLTEIRIPTDLTQISDYMFEACGALERVTNFNNVTTIGQSAFNSCINLKNDGVPIHDGTSSIDSWAFAGCSKLTEITIPNSINTIAQNAFDGCPIETATVPAMACLAVNNTKLKTVTITGGSSIDGESFKNCDALTTVTFDTSLTSIGDEAFYNCGKLEKIEIPNTVTSIGGDAFSGCTIKDIKMPANVISAIPNTWFETVEITSGSTINTGAFTGAVNLQDVSIANTVTTIGEGAFSGCQSLQRMTLPFVGGSATASSADATTLFGYIFGTTSYNNSIETPQFYDTSNHVEYYLPKSLTWVKITGGKIYFGAFYHCELLEIISIPNNLTMVGNGAFAYCKKLTNINSLIPSLITRIGYFTFAHCESLYGLSFSSRITSIDRSAFWGCTKLETLYMPNSITNIDESAFENCTSLSTILTADNEYFNVAAIPSSVIHIGKNAFKGCPCLKLANAGYYVGNWLVDYNNALGLISLSIKSDTVGISDYALYGMSGQTSTTIPSDVTYIGAYSFVSTAFTSVTFSNKSGWQGLTSYDSSGGTLLNLNNDSTNATYLKTTYADKYWKRG